jgi:DNA polymerase-3 subunit beta
MSRGPTTVAFERDTLASALRDMTGAVARGLVPAFNCVLIEPGSSTTLTAANDVFQASVSLASVTCDGESPALINAERLSSVVQSFSTGSHVSIEIEGQAIRVRSGRASLKLHGEPVAAFPRLPAIQSDAPASLPGDQLGEAFGRVLFAAEEADELAIAPWKTGVSIFTGGGAVSLATGAKSGMARDRFECPGVDADFVLPIRTVDYLRRRLSSGEVAIHANQSAATIIQGSLSIRTRLVECQRPDFDKYIPTGQSGAALLDPRPLADALARALLVNDQRNRMIKLEFEPELIRVSSAAAFGSGADEVPCEFTGEPVTLGARADQLRNAIAALNPDTLRIRLGGPSDPITLTSVARQGCVAVVMPMQL